MLGRCVDITQAFLQNVRIVHGGSSAEPERLGDYIGGLRSAVGSGRAQPNLQRRRRGYTLADRLPCFFDGFHA